MEEPIQTSIGAITAEHFRPDFDVTTLPYRD